MTKHEFIFSDQRKHRRARHLAFWILWSLAYNLLFHFPLHVFKGWDVSGPGTKNFQELGPTLFFIKSLIINSFLNVVAPQIALTYILLYWLLPKYFYRKRNVLVIISVTGFVLATFFFTATLLKYSSALYNILAGETVRLPPYSVSLRSTSIDTLTSLPIVIGFALMIKLSKRWWLKQKEIEQLAKEKVKAELQLLKAQIHPHFLFNTLNNIYFFTLTNSAQAPIMIKKLSGILQYILNECNQPMVPLEKEIKMIRDYMALEKIRYAEQMQMQIEIEENHNSKMIAPLLLIPFVENSFKHGTSKMISQPWVNLNINIENNRLHFVIMNSKPLVNDSTPVKGNFGLKNVKKRLALLYPGSHELNIVSEAGCYAVYLSLQLQETKDLVTDKNEINPHSEYAMA